MRSSRIRVAAQGVAFSKRVTVSGFWRGLLAAVVALLVSAPAASAPPDSQLEDLLGALWVTVIETPTPRNLFNPDAKRPEPCVDLGNGIIAPFGPLFTNGIKCTVTTDTQLFIIGVSNECSTSEQGVDATKQDLRSCARAADAAFDPVVTVDGQIVALTEVETGLVPYELPEDNIFSTSTLTGELWAHGWVTLLPPLTIGKHTITIDLQNDGVIDSTTTIIVKPSA
ncbi:hypothetical protein [Polyangium sp. y55x31]|uniref:hypothetical protein n=1 Tax=Polyangium sp. y55x31 TaxID=3042688 RepID=UPI00248247F4|nr:hypothetical protein [Polyangium sp. y55x31]MDI1475360.1 hypothetical protein [Polyangium sp. y55x31]